MMMPLIAQEPLAVTRIETLVADIRTDLRHLSHRWEQVAVASGLSYLTVRAVAHGRVTNLKTETIMALEQGIAAVKTSQNH